MGLNKQSGNMYPWVTHTWNPLAGQCPHKCTYCYVKKIVGGKEALLDKYGGKPRLWEPELATHLGEGRTIFISNMADLFAEGVDDSIIESVINHTRKYPGNRYLWQTKNPDRFFKFLPTFPMNSILCTTIESNRDTDGGNAPGMKDRMHSMSIVRDWITGWQVPFQIYITVEPIMKFDHVELLTMLEYIKPDLVNIGADSGNNGLPEPTLQELKNLIDHLHERQITVHLKDNLKRIFEGGV